MDKATYDLGMKNRRAVAGDAYVDNSIKNADAFNMPMQDYVTEACWGMIWGREGLSHRDRSLINIAMIAVLNRPHELKTHVKGALRNGVTKEEMTEVFLQVACYAGMPAGVDSFRLAKEAFAEAAKEG